MNTDTPIKARATIITLSAICIALAIGLVKLSIVYSNDKELRKSIEDSLHEQKKVIEKIKSDKREAEQKYARLQNRINPGRKIWLPEKLVFAGQKVPVDNWYIRESIREEIKAFTSTAASEELTKIIRRSKYWFPYTEQAIKKQNFFEDVKYLCVQESGLNPVARSYRNAQGICQFMAHTAKEHGLRINWQVDERLLPERAIEISVRHVKDLYQEFNNDIFLALAAYNAGTSRIKNVIENNNGNDNYFRLGYLPYETEEFVYKIIAWKLILENPRKYYINPVPDSSHKYPEIILVDTILSKTTPVDEIARHHDTGYPEFRALNPHIKRKSLGDGEHTFRIPTNKR